MLVMPAWCQTTGGQQICGGWRGYSKIGEAMKVDEARAEARLGKVDEAGPAVEVGKVGEAGTVGEVGGEIGRASCRERVSSPV